MTREKIREKIRIERENISVIHAAELSARISEKVLALPEYKQAETVMCYASLLSEVRTESLNAKALADGKKLLLPKTHAQGRMDAVHVTDLSLLRPGKMQIPELETGEAEDPARIDLVLVPGVAFDKKGGRLGYGSGYYDRFLAKTRALKVALAFEMQIVEDTLALAHDQKMDMLITEERVYDFRA
ncbi:MAG: 5-formyltetrahydrofolate cyclo-ligase [Clostridia bacterium]|nr:5-formyltetrahydrofolate cyclo-ligase [Clostridia bacterium]